MDFMNIEQAAMGDREHGFIMTAMRIARKSCVGSLAGGIHHRKIGSWTRAAAARTIAGREVRPFGDNMRETSPYGRPTSGAQIKFGFSVNTPWRRPTSLNR